jgi:hypothetical protein
MFFRESPRLFDVVRSKDFSGEVGLHDVLQAGDLRVIEKAAPRADVGIDEARVRRILPPVRQLVAVGIEDRVEAKGLNDDLPKLASELNRKNLS